MNEIINWTGKKQQIFFNVLRNNLQLRMAGRNDGFYFFCSKYQILKYKKLTKKNANENKTVQGNIFF